MADANPQEATNAQQAEDFLLPEGRKAFETLKAQLGNTMSPDVEIAFSQEQRSPINFASEGGLVRRVTMPESVHRWGAEESMESMASAADYKGTYKTYQSTAGLNNISALAVKSGDAMPIVYNSTENIGTPAAAGITKDGVPLMFVDPKFSPDVVKAAAAHEMGHEHNEYQTPEKAAQALADIHNDPSGAISRQYETRADMYAVKLGQGAQFAGLLNQYAANMDKKGFVPDFNDKTHPAIADRVAAINAALAGVDLSSLPKNALVEADHQAKTPTSAGTAPVSERANQR